MDGSQNEMGDEQRVIINDTEYSLAELPRKDSQLVSDERAKLLATIDLKYIREEVGPFCESFRAAYEGGLAAWPKLQMEIKDLGFYVLTLLGKSVTACSQCKRAYTTIESIIETLYDDLIKGFEDVALENVADVSTISEQIAPMAREVSRNFEDMVERVHRSFRTPGTKAEAQFMIGSAYLWKQMAEHCEYMPTKTLEETMKKTMERFDNQKRQRLWRSTVFKRKTVTCFAGWVAFGGVCEEIMLITNEAQRNLYKCIMTNLSCKGAKR